MKTNIKRIKCILDVETPYDNLDNVCDALCTLPLVKDVTLVKSDVNLKDISGILKRGLDGLQYQREQRGE